MKFTSSKSVGFRFSNSRNSVFGLNVPLFLVFSAFTMPAVVLLGQEQEGSTPGSQVRVVISAEVSKEYRASHQQGGDLLSPETFTLAQGQFFPGINPDESLKKIGFEQLMLPLAYGLAQQSYQPTKEPSKADLLVIVHWGVTEPADFDDVMEDELLDRTQDAVDSMSNTNPLLNDYAALNSISAMQENIDRGLDRQIAANARLLGYSRALVQARMKYRRKGKEGELPDVAKELAEERYFIVVSAWDNQLIQNSGERKLLWITRTSLPATGHSFAMSIPTLIREGCKYYGKHFEELQKIDSPLGPIRKRAQKTAESAP